MAWDHYVTMMFGVLSNCFSLREIQMGLDAFGGKLKQNFQPQYFVGDNQNAIEIQLWRALIAVLLLSVIHSHNKSKISFSNVAALVRIHLAGYISIKDLLALHNKKRGRGAAAGANNELFSTA